MTTVEDVFAELPQRLNREAAAGLSKLLQWDITGDESGQWAVRIADSTAEVIPGGVESPDAIFTIKDQDWIHIADGSLDGMKAFMSGRLKVKGDMAIAMKMAQLFPVPTAK